ncbi:UDP-galactose transporter 1 [Neolecta irregularis DAH-3]|uniref:UDP-galactose transporter 1 n=1 Tax=Neolecta irregularis (strain DAH-3) TaxID=1198029 RepID=A0A1U7LS17_NEOID|nr:UDP-galactose transporter 1 [Neolecta irregularis DAH-3]|eukprot:OLL25466.1 UDP-galactose transporter 1 [Neolecta irregularis DAH-3]
MPLRPTIHRHDDAQSSSAAERCMLLAVYFLFNLGLTIYNKLVMDHFPFPYIVTGVHALCASCGSYLFLLTGVFRPVELYRKEQLVLLLFSFLYTINIAVSNISLNNVTVPLHQVVRAITPLFTILIFVLAFRKSYSFMTYVSVIPLVAGVGLATYGDYYVTTFGFLLTLLGTFLAAVKTVMTNRLLTGRLKLDPLDLLFRMSPLAFMQTLIYASLTGELSRFSDYARTGMTRTMFASLLGNGIIAFGLNVVSFTANQKCGALTLTVAANIKQVLTVALSFMIFDLKATFTNVIGIILALAGGAIYAYE